jgi:hypothetical protein
MRRKLWCLLVLLAAGLHPTPAAATVEQPAGRVKNASGEAFVIRGELRSAAQPGSAVFQNDVLETGEDSSLGVTFRDESRLALGPDTRLVVDEYVYQPEGDKSFLTRLVRGTVLCVSGVIAKLSPDAAEMETPDGTIGIRGTRFLVKLVPREPE